MYTSAKKIVHHIEKKFATYLFDNALFIESLITKELDQQLVKFE